MELHLYDGKPVRLTTTDGDVFEGLADFCGSGWGLHEFGREEESLRLGVYQLFEGDIASVEPLDEERLCDFYGAEFVPEKIRALYRDLKHVWCAETCTPRMRASWSPDNPTLGQCSITAFLVQELFGGAVYGIQLPDGGVHCYNEIDDHCFDLTSEQFGDEELDYFQNPVQYREAHFARAEKRARFELLKKRLEDYRRRRP